MYIYLYENMPTNFCLICWFSFCLTDPLKNKLFVKTIWQRFFVTKKASFSVKNIKPSVFGKVVSYDHNVKFDYSYTKLMLDNVRLHPGMETHEVRCGTNLTALHCTLLFPHHSSLLSISFIKRIPRLNFINISKN